MSNKPRLFREVTLRSAIKVLTEAGHPIAGAEISPDGTVRILTTIAPIEPIDGPNPFDRPQKRDRV